LNELFNDALKTSEVILAFEERYKDIEPRPEGQARALADLY
jgi:hypothetical protein